MTDDPWARFRTSQPRQTQGGPIYSGVDPSVGQAQQRIDIASQAEARAQRGEQRTIEEQRIADTERQREESSRIRELRNRQAQIVAIRNTIKQLGKATADGSGIGSIEGQDWFREGSWGSGLFNQDANNVASMLETVVGDLTQQQIAKLAEINNGGVTGMANTTPEARRMAAALANLSQTADEETFGRGLRMADEFYQRTLADLEEQLGGQAGNQQPAAQSPQRQGGSDLSQRAQNYLRQARGN